MTLAPNKIFDARGNLIWQGGLGAVNTTNVNRATGIINQSSALVSQLKDSKPSETPNNVGKACTAIAIAAGTVAQASLVLNQIPGVGTIVSAGVIAVAASIAAVASLIGLIWGSDADEATYAQAAQLTAENTKIERENYQLDQKRDALVQSIQNAMPVIRVFAKQENIDLQTAVNGLAGLMQLGAATAQQQLNSAQATNDFLKAQQNQRILDIAELTKSFEAVADTLVAKQRQLKLMNTIQTYGSYGAGAAGLGALVYGGLKLAKGEIKTGAISAGSGVALAALAYWLYTQSQKTEVLSQQGQQVLKQAEVAINTTNQSQFPTKAQMIAAMQWYGTNDNKNRIFLAGGEYQNAINATYNEKTGTFNRGDWVGTIVSSNPVKIKNTKGGEVFYLETTYFLSKNRGVNGFRGYAEELKGIPARLLR
jgi:cell division protein FtsB